jgi:mevalonate kinase
MKWQIPAKTFLLGEYAALAEASAMVVTTTPYFELSLRHHDTAPLQGIHPESPAGLWWQKQASAGASLSWYDPYQGCGGLGASSAQFIGSYLASCALKDALPSLNEMLNAYYQCAWNGQGLRPSGYDLIAQAHYGCVYINKHQEHIQTYAWPFKDLSFFLIHTGVKLATHHHLQQVTLPSNRIKQLSTLVDQANEAFTQQNSHAFIECIKHYHQQLKQLNLVAEHSLLLIEELSADSEILAVKGCGALGADIILILTDRHNAKSLHQKLKTQNKKILATETMIAQEHSGSRQSMNVQKINRHIICR